MSNNDSDFGAFLSGLVIGGLVGAAVALLLAPQSGEETRTVIVEKSIELKDRAMEQAEGARTKVGEVAGAARERVTDAAEQARTKAGEVAAATKEKAAGLQQRGQVVLEEQKERLEKAIEAGKQAAQRKMSGGEEAEAAEAAE